MAKRYDSEGVVMSKIESEIFIPTYWYDKDHNFAINNKIEKVRGAKKSCGLEREIG